MLSMHQVNAFEQDGYLLARGVFAPAEIDQFRKFALEYAQGENKWQHTDVLSIPSLKSIILDGRIAEIAKQVLDVHNIVYFADSSLTIHGPNPVGGFHRDNTDRWDGNAPDWHSSYNIIRFGLYLQDHQNCSGGLLVRAGSHNSPPWNHRFEWVRDELLGVVGGSTRYLNIQKGDVVFWNLRTSHAGHGRAFKVFNREFPITSKFQNIIPTHMQTPSISERIAVFCSIGANGEHLERYVHYLKRRKDSYITWSNINWQHEDVAALEKLGVVCRNIGNDLGNKKDVEVINDGWAPVPY